MPVSCRHRYPAWLRTFTLALLLILTQLGALTHALGHLKDTQGKPAETFCEWCVAYAQGAHAAPGVPLASPLTSPCPTFDAARPVPPLRQAVFFAYLSQAPPLYS